MALIDLRTDFAFKRVFGAPDSQPLLKSLLNSLLYGEDDVIQAVTLRESYLAAQLPGVHYAPLTVKVQLNDQTETVVEVQLLSLPTLGKRVLYNAAKSYGSQISREETQREVLPLTTLNLLDFEMFPEQVEPISRFAFQELDKGFTYPNNGLSLHFVELPKFTKESDQLETLADCWLYLMKYASVIEELPPLFSQVPELQQACEWADESLLNREEFDILQQQLFFIADQRRSLSFGREEGLQQGIQTGRQQGIEQGVQQGREEGLRAGVQQGREEGFHEGVKQGQQKGLQQGRTEGVHLGQQGIVIRFLTRRFGRLNPQAKEKIQALPGERLEALAEVAWDFITDRELNDWLDGRF